MKALKKEKVINNDCLEDVITNRIVLALGSSFQYLTHLHSTFTTPVCTANINSYILSNKVKVCYLLAYKNDSINTSWYGDLRYLLRYYILLKHSKKDS